VLSRDCIGIRSLVASFVAVIVAACTSHSPSASIASDSARDTAPVAKDGGSAAKSTALASDADRDNDARMKWWREARFGLFIHWGLYSIPAGEWKGRTDHAEWIRTTAQIPIGDYDKFLQRFNPVKFDADAWVHLAKEAGMQYIVITSKHHDGFCLFDSKYTDFDVMSTPFHRDILKELSDACRKQGIHMCFYHSIMDWHHPDYLPRREWEKDRPTEGAVFSRYVDHLHKQIGELLTNYGPIGVLWFDGEWESNWTNDLGRALYDECRSLQPSIIVNNRVSTGRSGMAGMTKDASFPGDFGTPEQEIPAAGLPGVDWESCMTMNDHWGYNKADANWKSTQTIVRMLCDIASKGGNLLLNIGPTSEGVFPPEAIERLHAVGKWMAVNGESIHGTSASPFGSNGLTLAWGRCTQKKHGADTTLFLHVFDWPKDGKLWVSGLANKVVSASLLEDPGHLLTLTVKNGEFAIRVPSDPPDPICSVIALDIQGAPIVFSAPKITAGTHMLVRQLAVSLSAGTNAVDVRYTLDGSEPDGGSPRFEKPIVIDKTTTVKARTFQGDKAVTGTTTETFTKVAAAPAANVEGLTDGLVRDAFHGEWDKIPDFDKLPKSMTSIAPTIGLDLKTHEERYGLRFSGYLVIPADDAYTLALTSDDGARLYVDGKLAVDNDGLHSSEEKRADLPLAAGPHAIKVEYFNKTGQSELVLRLARSGEKLEPIPASALKHGQ
jgi:alpha-L-fucosidase